jgi:hypothetical protein
LKTAEALGLPGFESQPSAFCWQVRAFRGRMSLVDRALYSHAYSHPSAGAMWLSIRLLRAALSPQLTAFFTSVLILASSAAVNSFSAKEVGHIAPSSRFAPSLNPNVAYLDLNFDAGVKKQTTLPSLA